MFRKKDENKSKILNKAYRFKIHPNETQKIQINKTFGCVRFVYNYFLNERKNIYKYTRVSMSLTDCNNDCNKLKKEKEYYFLKEVDKFALTNALIDLNNAYTNFFREIKKGNKNWGYPKFKSKRNEKHSYTTNITNGNIKVDFVTSRIQLPKLGKVKFNRNSREDIKGDIKRATITKYNDETYYVSIITEIKLEKELKSKEKYTKEEIENLIENNKIKAFDLGIKHFAISSEGIKIENPRIYIKAQNKLRKLNKKLARQQKSSKSYSETLIKISKMHRKIANCRKDFLHKLSTKIINENQVIILEDLNVCGMVKNKKLSKQINDVGWGYFKTFLKYKARWHNKTVILIDRFYPSSKTCSCCKKKNTMLTLSDRKWICPNCKTELDRDENAAINILEEGIRLLTA